MIIKTEELKKITDNILPAVDSTGISNVVDNLEMYTEGGTLFICVTNKEYYVKARMHIGTEEIFHATVNATLFLKLISQITTDDIEMTIFDDSSLHIKANGSYNLPLIYDGKNLLVLPKIEIENPTCEMSIKTEILQSILKYNSKELSKGIISRPVQKMYYVDGDGAITFTTGACVNAFKLPKPVNMLLSGKVVRLFKLFNSEEVKFTMGYDSISDSIIQTKVRFDDGETELTAILQCDDTTLRSVPVANIRGRAENIYPYSVVINKNSLIQSINRLMVMLDRGNKNDFQFVATFKFDVDGVTISDDVGKNSEYIGYANKCEALSTPYTAQLNINDIKTTLQVCDDAYLTFNFGDNSAFVISRANIFNIIPECHF